MAPLTHGIHHITAMASDARRNLAFYTQILGLRLVKQTVNFDDPGTYHLYYANYEGAPGTVLTFFPWPGLRRGRPGTGQVYATAFSIPAGSLPYWQERLRSHQLALAAPVQRIGGNVIGFADPDGLILELIETAGDPRPPTPHPDIPAAHAIRGFHSATLALSQPDETAALLTGLMGYRESRREANRVRYAAGDGQPGTFVDVLVDPSLPRGLNGAGTVHHIAYRTPDDATELRAKALLERNGFQVSPVMDRNYFHSIYYREPEGILFEIATDPPGFTVDESLEQLGSGLRLPAKYEARRADIEAALPPLA